MTQILLLEPGYPNKYPPLGLMKIAAWHKEKGDYVLFRKGVKGGDAEIPQTAWDRVYITTLFSFEFKRIAETIDFALQCVNGQHHRIFVGGIAASLMQEEFLAEPRWQGIRFIRGLLDKAPAVSLQLDAFNGDLYAEDTDSKPIEEYIPDYNILKDVDYEYPLNDAYFGYASRGCIRKCHFCGVPKLEGALRDSVPLTELVRGIAERHGEKRHLTLMDNNVTASPRYKEVIAEIVDLGFGAGAKLTRNGKHLQRRLDFNQGVDARILCKDPMYLREMAKTCINPLRIAFDHLGVKKPYIQAIRYANDYGIRTLSNYMLFNFMDKPEDLYERLRINIDLNRELDLRIWSFPMRYQPVTLKDRSHIGKNWSWYQLRSFQIILQATHGVVTGNPQFFDHAFGESAEKFHSLLLLPHHMIFHREYYEKGKGQAEREEFKKRLNRLNEGQKTELHEILVNLRSVKRLNESKPSADSAIRGLLAFFQPLAKEQEQEVTQSRKVRSIASAVDIAHAPVLSEDQRVEDAGLYEEDSEPPEQPRIVARA